MELAAEDVVTGLKVVLANPDPEYAIGRGNPAQGTPYACVGEVIDYYVDDDDEAEDYIEVAWENGEYNTYKNYELAEDSASGFRESIWHKV